MDLNSPSPKPEGILKIKESELLVHIRKTITEVIQAEFKAKLDSLEVDIEDVSEQNAGYGPGNRELKNSKRNR